MIDKLSALMPEQFKSIKDDVEDNLQLMVKSYLQKMDLVTREEFDIQKAVLLKTRKKVESLEKQVGELEALIKDSKPQ